ncbi:hypothetical protein LTR85_002628 [Meristemomyces frigidus]|nr:hypothetical protein LTR85_002628 [Meristemomyces frigidus]
MQDKRTDQPSSVTPMMEPADDGFELLDINDVTNLAHRETGPASPAPTSDSTPARMGFLISTVQAMAKLMIYSVLPLDLALGTMLALLFRTPPRLNSKAQLGVRLPETKKEMQRLGIVASNVQQLVALYTNVVAWIDNSLPVILTPHVPKFSAVLDFFLAPTPEQVSEATLSFMKYTYIFWLTMFLAIRCTDNCVSKSGLALMNALLMGCLSFGVKLFMFLAAITWLEAWTERARDAARLRSGREDGLVMESK